MNTITTVVAIPINDLVRDPNHPRHELGNPESLVLSLQTNGVLTPVSVIKDNDGKMYVIDGWRRIEILRDIGETEVQCILSEGYAPDKAAHQSYVMNTERNQLNEIDIALHIKGMQEKFGYTFKDLEIKGYGSPTQISKKLKLLELPKELQKQIMKKELTVAHGLELLELKTDTERENMAKRVIQHDLSAKATKKAIADYNLKSNNPKVQITAEADSFTNNDSEITVYNKDSRNMSEIIDESVELIFTSPPCFAGMEYEKCTFSIHLDNIEAVMKECGRVLAKGGVLAMHVTDIYNFKGGRGNKKSAHIELMTHRYQAFLKQDGILLEDQVVWVKEDLSKTTSGMTDRIQNQHEFIHIFRKKGEKKAPSEEMKLQSSLTQEERNRYFQSVWRIPQVRKMDGHPAISPDELAHRIIKMYSFKGDTVLDPFLGSGTTVKVARELGRRAVGYEREEKYMATINSKLAPPAKSTGIKEFARKTLDELENNQPSKTNILSQQLRVIQNKLSQAASGEETNYGKIRQQEAA